MKAASETHDLTTLLDYVATVDALLADSLRSAEALTPFGVEIRYPGDAPEIREEEEICALTTAERVRERVMEALHL